MIYNNIEKTQKNVIEVRNNNSSSGIYPGFKI